MADLQKTVEIIFQGTDKLGGVVGNIGKSLDSFESGIGTMVEPVANLADGVLAVNTALFAMAAGGMAYAYTESMRFESAATNLSKILGDQKTAISGISQATLEMSNKYGIASTSIMESATEFKRASFSVNEVLALTENAIGLVVGAAEAELQQAEATEIIIATLKGFKAPAEEAGRLTDILNKVSNEYATSVTELGVGMSTLSPIAKKMGFSFEETAGILTPVIEIFRSGDEASTALKMGLLKLIDDAAPVQAALSSIGVAQMDANGQLRSGRDILFDVADAFQHVDNDQKLFVASQLVGIRQAAKMVEVFDGLKYSTEITATAMAAGGSIMQEVAAKLETSEIAINRLKVGFENLGIAVGDEFRQAATGAIGGITDIENSLQKLVSQGAFDEIFEVVRDMSGEFKTLLTTIADMLPEAIEKVDFSELTDSIRDLGGELIEAFEALFGDVDLSTPEGLADVIQKVVKGGTVLTNVIAGIVKGLQPFLSVLGEAIESFTSMDSESQKAAGSVLGISQGIKQVLGVFSAFRDVLGGLTTAINGLVVVNAIKLFPGLKSTLKSVAGATDKAAGALIRFTWNAKALKSTGLLGMSASLGYMAGTLINKYIPGVSTTAEKVAEWSDKILNWTGTQGKANNDLEEARKMMEAYKKAADEAGEAVESLPTEVKTTVTIDAKGAEAEAVKSFLEIQRMADEYGIEQDFWVTADETKTALAAKAVTKVIEENLPSEKEIEITLQGAIDKELELIKTSAETVQIAMEWTAKLDIAEVEANAKIASTLAETLGANFQNTGDVIGDLFGLFASDLDMSAMWAIERQIKIENDLRAQTFELQKDLTEAQIEYMNAKTDALESGDMNLTVSGDGLAPHLEAFMWEILSAIQVRANAEGAEFLLGIE